MSQLMKRLVSIDYSKKNLTSSFAFVSNSKNEAKNNYSNDSRCFRSEN
jgi:hypothetical protein